MNASKLRMLIRAVVVCLTAFGLNLTADQVAAVYLLTEALLQFFVKDVTPANESESPSV